MFWTFFQNMRDGIQMKNQETTQDDAGKGFRPENRRPEFLQETWF